MVNRHDGRGVYTKVGVSWLILITYVVVISTVMTGLVFVVWG